MNEQAIRAFAMDLKIDLVGFFSVDPLKECLPHLEERLAQGFSTGFEGGPPQERIDYRHHFPGAKSGIVIGINYYQGLKRPEDDRLRGALAAVGWGMDYHLVLREKMNDLMKKINDQQNYQKNYQKKFPVSFKIFVDNSPLIDRGSAHRAGFGFFGKNNCLINETLGSYFFIGQILLDEFIEYAPVPVVPNGCGECRLCLDACPNGALGQGFTLDPLRCIANLTQKKDLTDEEKKRVTTYLYGCDLCQQVCPYNEKLETTKEKRFWIEPERAFPELEGVLNLSNTEFKRQFGKTAGGWRGKKVIVRNAMLLKKNKK